jgi:DNA-binding beta-propeller fold protein YncE
MDAIAIDQATHRLYTADRSNQGVDVFDISAGWATYLQTIALPASPNGLALAPDLGRLFVGMGNGSVAVVDIAPTADRVISEIKTGAKSVDLLDYSTGQHAVYASNGVEGLLTTIDTNTGAVKAQFKIGFALEQPRFNPADGLLYVTSPDADALFRQLDPQLRPQERHVGKVPPAAGRRHRELRPEGRPLLRRSAVQAEQGRSRSVRRHADRLHHDRGHRRRRKVGRV